MSLGTLPHVTISNSGHRDHGPPEGIGYGLEERLVRAGLREIYGGGEQHHT